MKSLWRSFKNRGFLVCLCLSALLFGGGIMLGLITPGNIKILFLEELAALGGLGFSIAPFEFTAVLLIFLNNALTILFGFALSPFLFLVPTLILAVNGWVLGLVGSVVAGEKSVGFVLAGLLPHGVIEVPTLLIGGAAALSFGVVVLGAVFSGERRQTFPADFKRHLKYLAVVIVLLLAAVVIETYITPLFLGVR